MNITAFTKADRRGTRFLVTLDGVPWVELDAETIVRERLGKGQSLSAADQARILATDEIVRARKAAAANHARSRKTRRELETLLRRRKFSAAAIEAALGQLTATGTLDDAVTAERHVKSRRRKADMGPRRLQAELHARGVERAEAERQLARAFEGADLRAECRDLATKIAPRYQPLSDARQRQKLAGYLLRRGYAGDLVSQAIRALGQDAPELAE